MNVPTCPNHLEGKGCEKSELRLLGENPQSWAFFCTCCKLSWLVSKSRTKEEARWNNAVKNMRQASEQERIEAARPKVFGRHYAGVRR